MNRLDNELRLLNEIAEQSETDDYMSELEDMRKRMQDNIQSASAFTLSTEKELSDSDIESLINQEFSTYGVDGKLPVQISGISNAADLMTLISTKPDEAISRAIALLGRGINNGTVDNLIGNVAEVVSNILLEPKKSSNTAQKFKIPKDLVKNLALEVKSGKYDAILNNIKSITKSLLLAAKTQLASVAPVEKKIVMKRLNAIITKLSLFVKYIKLKSKFVKDAVVNKKSNKDKYLAKYTYPAVSLGESVSQTEFIYVDLLEALD